MHRWVLVLLWLVGTLAATGLAFAAVGVVGDVGAAPEVLVAPTEVPAEVGQVDVGEGTLAVECDETDGIALAWASPNGGASLEVVETGPERVVVLLSADDTTEATVVCRDLVPVLTLVEIDDPATEPTDPSTTTTESDDDDEPSTTSTTEDRPATPGSSTSTSTTEPDDDDDGPSSTSTTEDDPDEPDETTTTTEDPDEPDEPDETTTTTEDPDD